MAHGHHESGAAVGGEARPGEETRMSALVLHPVGAGSHLDGMFFNLEKTCVDYNIPPCVLWNAECRRKNKQAKYV